MGLHIWEDGRLSREEDTDSHAPENLYQEMASVRLIAPSNPSIKPTRFTPLNDIMLTFHSPSVLPFPAPFFHPSLSLAFPPYPNRRSNSSPRRRLNDFILPRLSLLPLMMHLIPSRFDVSSHRLLRRSYWDKE